MDREQGGRLVWDAEYSARHCTVYQYDKIPEPAKEVYRSVFDTVAAALRAEHEAEVARLRKAVQDCQHDRARLRAVLQQIRGRLAAGHHGDDFTTWAQKQIAWALGLPAAPQSGEGE